MKKSFMYLDEAELNKTDDSCQCGNILETGKKYCSDVCQKTNKIGFDPALAYTSLPYNNKHYYGAMKWGYDGDLESNRNRQDRHQKWTYDYELPVRPPLDFDVENELAAQILNDHATEYGLDIQVLLSGGLDSIITAEAFRQAKIPFTAVTWRFTTGENEHDIKHARKYCEKHNIKQQFIDIDIRNFLFEQVLDYSMPIQTISPGRAIMCYIIDQLDGYPVFGGGEPFVYFDHNEKYGMDCVMTSEGEPMQYVEKWLMLKDRPGCPRFFRTTTEQVLSGILSEYFWKIIIFMEEIGDQLPFFSNVYGHPRNMKRRESESAQAKHNAYSKYYPDIDTYREPITHEWQGPEAGLIKKTSAYTGYEYLEKEFRISNWLQMKRLPIKIFQHFYDEPVINRIEHLLTPKENEVPEWYDWTEIIHGDIMFRLREQIKNARTDQSRVERIRKHVGL